MNISGAGVARETLISAAGKVPQKPEWVVVDGHLKPMTFLEQLDLYQGSTIGGVAESAEKRMDEIAAHRRKNLAIGWGGLGVGAASGLLAALTPFKGVAMVMGVIGVGGVANWGFTGARWDRDEMSSTRGFVGELGEWGTILSGGKPQAA